MAGTAATLLAVLLWSFHATIGDLTVQNISPMQLTVKAYLLSSVLLVLLAGMSRTPVSSCLRDLGKPLFLALCASGPVMMLYYLALYQGMSKAPAVDVYIIHYLWPVFAALFIKMFLGRTWGHKGLLSWLFMLMSFAGAGIVIMGGGSSVLGSGSFTGYAMAAVSAVCGGLYLPSLVAAGDKLTRIGYAEHAGFLMPYLILIAAGLVSLAVMSPAGTWQANLQAGSLTGTLFVGLGIIVAAEMAWVLGVRWNRSQSTAALAYLTPVFSTILLIFISKEHVHPHSVLGIALIVGANILMQKTRKAGHAGRYTS